MQKAFLLFYGIVLMTSCGKNPQDDTSQAVTDPMQYADGTIATTDSVVFEQLVQSYEDPERREWQNPDLIIQKFGNLSEKKVADIGAGTGYFTFKLADRKAQVIAIDIDERFLDYIIQHKQEMSVADSLITTRLSKEDDPLLKPEEIDYALVVNTYYFLGRRDDYLKNLRTALKPNGQIIVVDFKEGNLPVGPLDEYKISPSKVEEELNIAGFSSVELDTLALDYQYIVTATK